MKLVLAKNIKIGNVYIWRCPSIVTGFNWQNGQVKILRKRLNRDRFPNGFDAVLLSDNQEGIVMPNELNVYDFDREANGRFKKQSKQDTLQQETLLNKLEIEEGKFYIYNKPGHTANGAKVKIVNKDQKIAYYFSNGFNDLFFLYDESSLKEISEPNIPLYKSGDIVRQTSSNYNGRLFQVINHIKDSSYKCKVVKPAKDDFANKGSIYDVFLREGFTELLIDGLDLISHPNL